MTFTLRTPFAPSLFSQCWEYLAAGATGQDEHGKLETVPVSLRDVYESVIGWPYRNAYCYECGSRENVTSLGFMARCGGCRASERQQMREQAARDREYERDDERSDA